MSSKAYLASFIKKLSGNPFLVLDTETTGLGNAEIVQIAIINSEGETLLDELVKPVQAIPARASAIHKITNEKVATAPSWLEVAPKVAEIIKGQTVVIYNLRFDVGMLGSSDVHAHKKALELDSDSNLVRSGDYWQAAAKSYLCAMNAFSVHNGEWNSRRRSYAWKSLSDAAKRLKVPVADAHSALGDCRMTLSVVKAMLKAHSEGIG